MASPHTLSWTNPTTNTDGTAYNASTDNAGYTLQLDGVGTVSIPLVFGTTFDMYTLDAFQALKAGLHTASLQVVSKQGVASDFSSAATFSVAGKPSAPTNLVVA